MVKQLKNELVDSLFHFKKAGMDVRSIINHNIGHDDLNMAEIILIKGIARKSFDSCTEVSSALCVTKAAVSQMLSALEKKAYVTRAVNSDNRRKQVLSLTTKGKAFIEENDRCVDKVMETLIKRFGKNKTKELILLLDDFTRMVEEIKESA
jgi:DNA-binding MarR family transcriptional regulator